MSGRSIIATRKLLYSYSGNLERHEFSIFISKPFFLTEGSVQFNFNEGAAGCIIGFSGLPEKEIIVYGGDRIQALKFAVEIDPFLRGLSRKYEFFWENGDPYFNEI